MNDDWKDQARCRTWHGGHNQAAFVDSVKELREFARRVCGPCPVKQQCLMEAFKFEVTPYTNLPLRHEARYGVWGGLLPAPRERAHREWIADGTPDVP